MSDGGISFGAVCSYLFENKIKVSKIKNMFLGAESKLKTKHKKSLKFKNLNLNKNFNFLLEEINH